jgi:hypothetical protein
VELHLGRHPPRLRPTRRLVEEAFVPHRRFMAGSSHGPRQQFRNVPFQASLAGIRIAYFTPR